VDIEQQLIELKKLLDDRNLQDTERSEKVKAFEARLAEIEKSQVAKANEPQFGVDFPQDDVNQFSIAKCIMGAIKGRQSGGNYSEAFKSLGAKREWEMVNAQYENFIETGAVTKARHQAAVDHSGGLFIPEQVSSTLISALRERLVLEPLGVTVYDDISADKFKIPRQATKSSAAWVPENGVPTETSISFDNLVLEPHYCQNFVTISNVLLQMSPKMVEKLIRDDLAKQLRLTMEYSFLFGGGGVEPTGLIPLLAAVPGTPNRSQLNAGVGRRFNFDDAEIFRNAIEERLIDGDVAFLSRPTTWSLMKRQKVDHYAGQSVNQEYLAGRPPSTDAMLREFLGGDFKKTTLMPKTNAATGAILAAGTAAHVIGGVWEDFVLGFWNRIRLRVSTEASLANRSAFLQNETWLVFDVAADCNVMRTESFQYADDALQI